MTIGACLLFLACAFYLAFFAESLNGKAKTIVWSISLGIGLFPIFQLIYEYIRWAMR